MNEFGQVKSYLEVEFDIEFSDDLNEEGREAKGKGSMAALKFLYSPRGIGRRETVWGERKILSLLFKCLSLWWLWDIKIVRSNRKEVQKNYHFVTVGGISLVESVNHNSGGCHF